MLKVTEEESVANAINPVRKILLQSSIHVL